MSLREDFWDYDKIYAALRDAILALDIDGMLKLRMTASASKLYDLVRFYHDVSESQEKETIELHEQLSAKQMPVEKLMHEMAEDILGVLSKYGYDPED